jgi:hypothetical protein
MSRIIAATIELVGLSQKIELANSGRGDPTRRVAPIKAQEWARAGAVNTASAASARERSVDGAEHARIISVRSDNRGSDRRRFGDDSPMNSASDLVARARYKRHVLLLL